MPVLVDWSQKRQKHVLERMMLRGISRREFYDALTQGRKRTQRGDVVEVIHRYYRIVYEEVRKKGYTKIYPITVKVGP